MLGRVHSVTLSGSAAVKLHGGRYFRLLEADGPVDLTFYDDNGQPLGELIGVLGGFAVDARDFGQEKIGKTTAIFGSVGINSATAQTITVAITRVPVEYDRITGTISTTTSSGSTVTDSGAVAVTATATALIAAGSGRKAVRFYNNGANTVALGSASITFATGTVFVAPGEVWNESDGADAAWYAICNTGLATSINVQKVS